MPFRLADTGHFNEKENTSNTMKWGKSGYSNWFSFRWDKLYRYQSVSSMDKNCFGLLITNSPN